MMCLFADAAAHSWITSLHWALGLLTAGLFALHFRNRGRSGPIAALLFVMFGPALAVGLMLAWLVGSSSRDPSRAELYGLHISLFIEVMLLLGVLAAFLGAAIHGFRIRDELRAYREFGPPGWLGRLRTGMGPSPALAALGLPPTASLDEVERAYRELVKQAHPDRGGNVEQFKRLQTINEQAKRQAARRGSSAQKPQAAATAGDS
jgi:F0F1-type ATP synthase membrane subunit c/vacuolar-type H+-ATPase subunit K